MDRLKVRRKTISAKVFVGNLNFQTTKDELRAYLSEAGEVVDVYLPTDRATGRPRGFAFVEFASPDLAAAAIEKFNGTELAGRRLNINEAQDRPRRSPGGGPPPRQPRSEYRPQPGDFADFEGFGQQSESGGGGGGGGAPGGRRGMGGKPKGSRRGLRGRKRSL